MVSIIKGKLSELSLLQDPSHGIPSDVIFQIVRINREGAAEDKEVFREVTGHKIVLGAFSPVFKSMFFGPLKETKDVIVVEQTTVDAFQKMIDYIYQSDIDCSGMTVLDMYDIVNLAEMYHMPKLMVEIKTQMENMLLTMDNLMDVAQTATQFTQFDDVSSALLLTCSKFLQKTIRTPADQLQFAINQLGVGRERTALQLLVLAKDLPALECSNCGEEVDKCCDGLVLVGRDKFTVGRQMRVNKGSTYWTVGGVSFIGKVFTVISVETGDVVKVKESGVVINYFILRGSIPTFV